ncbi:MAG: S-formylglutathione hydrolase [Alphaproteobacteria bacterium]|nr:S-formylglutathione hydrolase [Alphaproteobacteria bacterium]
MKTIETHTCFGGTLGIYEHEASSTNCTMRFSVFVPPQAQNRKCPAIFFLSGLTCTEENFTVKAGAYRAAAELGLVVIAPDTSPRGDNVADAEGYDIGKGAGFYVNATQAPWAMHYQMETYITQELYQLITREFAVDSDKTGIMGHSMGGHGALVLGQRYPQLFRSISAFAPICAPTQCPWGHKVFPQYLGDNPEAWAQYDATALMLQQSDASNNPTILIDQGTADNFLTEQLHPDVFADACKQVGQRLILRMQEGYDHSYFFIQSFIDDHLRHHAQYLQ